MSDDSADSFGLGWGLEHPDLRIGWILARSVRCAPSGERLDIALQAAVAERARSGLDDTTKVAIRDLLRGHGYKPAGRGKPASEFLAAMAQRDEFPRVNNIVEINNLVSLETGWPASVFDLDLAIAGGASLQIRRGRPGEQFVFNAAGQSIDLGGLVCVAQSAGAPIGNPVTDSMATKIHDATRSVLAVIYVSRSIATEAELAAVVDRYAVLLAQHAGARTTRTGLLPASRPGGDAR